MLDAGRDMKIAVSAATPATRTEVAPITVSPAARILKCSEAAVRALERRGDLQATRTSTGIRLFDRAAVERLALERAERTRAPGGPIVPPEAA